MTTTNPYNTADPVPEGQILIEGTHLAITVRGKWPFRVAQRQTSATNRSPVPVGILVRTEDHAAVLAAMAKRDQRKAHEARACNLAKRH